MIERITDDEVDKWMWRNASKELKKFVVSNGKEDNEIDWEDILEKTRLEASREKMREKERSQDEELKKLKRKIAKLEEDSQRKKN